MSKYRKKLVVIEAVQFLPEIDPSPEGTYTRVGVEVPSYHGDPDDLVTMIETLEGELIVSPGDWIITGVEGECYLCKPDIFEVLYEKVEEQ